MMLFQLLALEGPQTYAQIGQKLGFNERKLPGHMSRLAEAGLVEKGITESIGVRGRPVNFVKLSRRILEGAAQQLKEGAA